jgi:hypothetical protein
MQASAEPGSKAPVRAKRAVRRFKCEISSDWLDRLRSAGMTAVQVALKLQAGGCLMVIANPDAIRSADFNRKSWIARSYGRDAPRAGQVTVTKGHR